MLFGIYSLFFCYNLTIGKHVDILKTKMFVPVYINFVVYLMQMFKSIKWHNKYFLVPILNIFFVSLN